MPYGDMPMQQQTSAQSGYSPGMNFAPSEPLRKLKDNERSYEESSFAQFARELIQEIKGRDVESRRQWIEQGRLMSNLRSGKMVMDRDPIHGGPILLTPLPQRPRRDKHIVPLIQTNSSQLTSIWALSNPRAVTRSFGTTNRAQIQQALIDNMLATTLKNNCDELFQQEWSLSQMDYGTSAIRPFYDNRLNMLIDLKPIVEDQDRTIFEGFGQCMNCPKEGTPDEFHQEGSPLQPQCPECGSYNVSDMIPQQVASVPTLVGHEQVTQGDIGIELLPMPACNWDMRKQIQHSSYFDYASEVPIRMTEALLGVGVIAENSEDDIGLQVINALGRRGGSVEGWGRDDLFGTGSVITGKTAIMHESYFLPEWYTGTRFSSDQMTVSGEAIPAGVPLEKIFPDAMCLVSFNDGDVLVGAFNEKHRTKGCVYHIQSHSGEGKGTSDVADPAEVLNIAHTGAVEQLKRIGAGGGYAYDKAVLNQSQAKALLKPGAIVGVKMRGTQYRSLQEALWQVKHNEVLQSNLAFVASMSNMVNLAFQTTDFTNGVADQRVDVNTLGGQQMLAAQNQQRSAAPLRQKGYCVALIGEEIIDLFRTHIFIPKWYGTNDAFAIAKGRFLAGKDIPKCVHCDFVSDSEIPTNKYVEKQNTIEMLKASADLGMPFNELAQVDPRMAVWLTDKFNVNLPIFNWMEILMRCQERLDDVAEKAEEAEQMMEMSGFYPPPEMMPEVAMQLVQSIDIPVTASETNLTIKADVLREYLDDDEVGQWSQFHRLCFNKLIEAHYIADAQFRTGRAGLEQQGALALQGQATTATAAQQQPIADQQNNQAIQTEALGRVADQAQKEDDFNREQDGKDRDLEREKQAKAVDQKNTMEKTKYEFRNRPNPSSRRK